MEHTNPLERIEIILVEPQDGANIGSTCRAMQTMGMTRLSIIGDKVYDEERIRTLAVHAFSIWEHHTRYRSLEEAISESLLVVGASRRRGKKRKYFSLLPEQLAERISQTGLGKVSIVFGREADGLTEKELNLCHMGVNIPSVATSAGSLNLAQAVQVITYTLFRNLNDIKGFEQIKNERIDEVSNSMTQSLESIGYYKGNEQEEVKRFFLEILARATLSEKEAIKIEKMFKKIAKIKVYKDISTTKEEVQ
ncbi:MAG: RNA methyltransferase [Spirochaetia bacterium]|nr:RNA methyltransferase [Spirochaetia bacterium]